jgi:hypothetical protein
MSIINFNPMVTSQPYGTFTDSTQGRYQGDFVDDPSSYQYLSAGQIAASVTQPVWGGMALTQTVSTTGNSQGLGPTMSLATAATGANGFNGFSVFTKNGAAILTPGLNNVPQLGAGMTVNYFRVGSNARINVAIEASLVSSLEGGNAQQALYWDPALQQLTASGTSGAFELPSTVKINSFDTNGRIVSYNSGTGALTWGSGAVAEIQI